MEPPFRLSQAHPDIVLNHRACLHKNRIHTRWVHAWNLEATGPLAFEQMLCFTNHIDYRKSMWPAGGDFDANSIAICHILLNAAAYREHTPTMQEAHTYVVRFLTRVPLAWTGGATTRWF